MASFHFICPQSVSPKVIAQKAFKQRPLANDRVGYTIVAEEIDEKVHQEHQALMESESTAILIPDREVKAVFFDMDATLIREETIVQIARKLGLEKPVSEITERAMSGELDFGTALKQRVALLKDLSVTEFYSVRQDLTLQNGIEEFSRFCLSRNIPVHLISGGFSTFAKSFSEELGFRAFRANDLEIVNDRLTGMVTGDIIDAEAKRDFVLNQCQQLAIDPLSALAIGDGANDIPMLDTVGFKIGFEPKKALLGSINGAMFHDHLPLIDIIELTNSN
ncbi:MAG: phosphoserine phosphatase SerB [Pseudobacteriovorax sp.]|nr:phosphoserine phosphatase SerB [Pseudobacteriovorax sp.]